MLFSCVSVVGVKNDVNPDKGGIKLYLFSNSSVNCLSILITSQVKAHWSLRCLCHTPLYFGCSLIQYVLCESSTVFFLNDMFMSELS